MSEFNYRTDLAVEAQEQLLKGQPQKKDFDGITTSLKKENDLNITEVKITNEDGAKKLGKPVGSYITIDLGDSQLKHSKDFVNVRSAISNTLNGLIADVENKTILIIGLGNWNVTPDALGPKVVSKLAITRHIINYFPDERDKGISPVCALAPGVLGVTGIETAEIIKGVTDRVKPDMIIAIDALASMKTERVNNTVQISDTGISPGSGVGNKRKELSKDTMGVPVYAIGIPTVVDAATMANDTLDSIIDEIIKLNDKTQDFYTMVKNIDKNEKQKLISKLFNPEQNMIVTPRDIDEKITELSGLIADSLNTMIHKDKYSYLQQQYLM